MPADWVSTMSVSAAALAPAIAPKPAVWCAAAAEPALADLNAEALLRRVERQLALSSALRVVRLKGDGRGPGPVARLPAACSPRQAVTWDFRAAIERSLYSVGDFLVANVNPDGSLRHEAVGRLACRTWSADRLGRALEALRRLRDRGTLEILRLEHLRGQDAPVDFVLAAYNGHLVGTVPVSTRVGLATVRQGPEPQLRRARAFVHALEERRRLLEHIARAMARQAAPTPHGRCRLGTLSSAEVARSAGLEIGALARICRNKRVRLPGGGTAMCAALFAS